MFGHARNAISAYQKAGVEAAVEVADPHRLILLLFVASILKLSAQSYSPFLYFQF